MVCAEPRLYSFSWKLLSTELHRDSLYPMMGKTLGWLGLTGGKPQGRSLCVWGVASGSAASHPNPGSSGMVEFSEESQIVAARTTRSARQTCGGSAWRLSPPRRGVKFGTMVVSSPPCGLLDERSGTVRLTWGRRGHDPPSGSFSGGQDQSDQFPVASTKPAISAFVVACATMASTTSPRR